MTTYAYDTSTHHLVAVWDTGIGAAARTVARLHTRTGETVAMNLAEALTRMSSAVWLTYTERFNAAVREEAAARIPERMAELAAPCS